MFNRFLSKLARFLPGGGTVRPWLHRLRGVRIGKNVWIAQLVYIDAIHPEKEIEHQITDLLHQIPLAEYILSIPGIGAVTCGVFLGELGNPDYFKDPGQIVKYAGYDPKENDSGLYAGRKIISKKGRWLLRKYLYFMAMRAVHRSTFFKEYYENKQKGVLRPLTKKEALCAVIIKLIRVIFALMRDRRMFTEEIRRAQAA